MIIKSSIYLLISTLIKGGFRFLIVIRVNLIFAGIKSYISNSKVDSIETRKKTPTTRVTNLGDAKWSETEAIKVASTYLIRDIKIMQIPFLC